MNNRVEITIGEKTYILQYTRRGMIKAEEMFGVSFMKMEDMKNFAEFDKISKALLYSALYHNHPTLKEGDMEGILDEFIGENGFEAEALYNDLSSMMEQAINPTGGGRRTTLFPKAKK